MDIKRNRVRVSVDIMVTITTVLDSLDGRIIDLSLDGAQIMDVSMALGARLGIDYEGQTIFARCVWSEVDRMGVHFPFGLPEGRLRELLVASLPGVAVRPVAVMDTSVQAASDATRTQTLSGAVRPLRPTNGFGRRARS
ncbi:MAG: PilZ domain-containing protein [Sphingobium sp.]